MWHSSDWMNMDPNKVPSLYARYIKPFLKRIRKYIIKNNPE